MILMEHTKKYETIFGVLFYICMGLAMALFIAPFIMENPADDFVGVIGMGIFWNLLFSGIVCRLIAKALHAIRQDGIEHIRKYQEDKRLLENETK